MAKVINKGMIISIVTVFLFAGGAFAGGGFEGSVELGTGTIEGPEAWAVITLQCLQGVGVGNHVDISLRAKRLVDCEVETDTFIDNETFTFDSTEGEACPADKDALTAMLMHYTFPPEIFPPLFGGLLERPIITKIKNASVITITTTSGDLTTCSFDAQLKNFKPASP